MSKSSKVDRAVAVARTTDAFTHGASTALGGIIFAIFGWSGFIGAVGYYAGLVIWRAYQAASIAECGE